MKERKKEKKEKEEREEKELDFQNPTKCEMIK